MKLIKIAAIAALLTVPACMASEQPPESSKTSWWSSLVSNVKDGIDDLKTVAKGEIDSIRTRYNTSELKWNDPDCLIIEGIIATMALYIGYRIIKKATRKKSS